MPVLQNIVQSLVDYDTLPLISIFRLSLFDNRLDMHGIYAC